MIEVRQMEFRYPRSDFRLRVDELVLERGQPVAFVGPSGSGKTTLLNLLAGILAPGRGSIRVGETDLAGLPDAERRRFRVRHIGFVFQSFELIEYLNVVENVLLPQLINPAMPPTSQSRARARELVAEVGLAGMETRAVHRLSHGEKQRVAIARALLNQPRYLLADEPTGNLDPANKEHIVELLQRQCARAGATLVLVTHDREVLGGFPRVIDFRTLLHRGEASP
jgi:putative ABC transport system ATP-binding protein